MTQRNEISTIESETITLEKQIATARSETVEKVPAQADTSPVAEQPEDEVLDWLKILPQLAEWNRGMGDYNSRMRFQKCLGSMTSAELAHALDVIASLDLPENHRDALAMAILPALANKDPEMAMDRFIDKTGGRRENPSIVIALERAMKVWAEKDPGSAGVWLDRRIAAGKYEITSLAGINQTRVSLEEPLFQVVFPEDPGSAGRRLMNMTTDEAFLLLGNFTSSATARENAAAFAELARQSLTDTQSLQILSKSASQPPMDYAAVSAYLDDINASPSEREACVAAAAESIFEKLGSERAITLEEVDAMRAWAGTHHSEIDRLTGKALGNSVASGGLSFDDASALVMHYHESTKNDEVLIGFLTSNVRCDITNARLLSEKIADPAKRTEMIEKFK